MPDHDVLVLGGGPVGAALCLALDGAGLRVALIEARPAGSETSDPRPLALSHGSRLLLERLGVWEGLDPVTPIERIHVSQRGGFGRVVLEAHEAGLPALGYVAAYAKLSATLRARLAAGGVEQIRGARVLRVEGSAERARVVFARGSAEGEARARLAVLAEGGVSGVFGAARVRDYRQSAITARVASALPHRNVAYERFTPSGPLALLPSGAEFALVWTVPSDEAGALCALPEELFLARLQQAFGRRLGAFTRASARALFPLALRVADAPRAPRLVAVGNAAQTLHPVAGQGFNLGLRDAWELARLVRSGAREEIGSGAQLAAFAQRRRLDRRGGTWFTDFLVRLFSNDLAPLRAARGLGLAALAVAPPCKDFLVRRMTFGARG
jgi:2-octaprenyl-6-methoxyphenol hydroxylase